MNTGGPIFPVDPTPYQDKDGMWHYSIGPRNNGMTLRDWFAGQALAAMTAAPDYSKGPCDGAMAERAYRIADEMLAERAKTTNDK